MFRIGDIVKIRSGQPSWEDALGKGVFDVVLEIKDISIERGPRTLITIEAIADPHDSTELYDGVLRAHPGDLKLEENYARKELKKIREEMDVPSR